MTEMKKYEQVQVLQKVLVAIEHASALTDAVDYLVGGYDVKLPGARDQSSALFWAMHNEKDRLMEELGLAPTQDQYGRLLLRVGQRFVYNPLGGPNREFELLSVDTLDCTMQWGTGSQMMGAIKLTWIWEGLEAGYIELLGDTSPGEDE